MHSKDPNVPACVFREFFPRGSECPGTDPKEQSLLGREMRQRKVRVREMGLGDLPLRVAAGGRGSPLGGGI